MAEHLGLGRPVELSLGPVYHCPICGQDLWTEKWEKTNWQEWCFTKDGKRHFKTRCNFQPNKAIQPTT